MDSSHALWAQESEVKNTVLCNMSDAQERVLYPEASRCHQGPLPSSRLTFVFLLPHITV